MKKKIVFFLIFLFIGYSYALSSDNFSLDGNISGFGLAGGEIGSPNFNILSALNQPVTGSVGSENFNATIGWVASLPVVITTTPPTGGGGGGGFIGTCTFSFQCPEGFICESGSCKLPSPEALIDENSFVVSPSEINLSDFYILPSAELSLPLITITSFSAEEIELNLSFICKNNLPCAKDWCSINQSQIFLLPLDEAEINVTCNVPSTAQFNVYETDLVVRTIYDVEKYVHIIIPLTPIRAGTFTATDISWFEILFLLLLLANIITKFQKRLLIIGLVLLIIWWLLMAFI